MHDVWHMTQRHMCQSWSCEGGSKSQKKSAGGKYCSLDGSFENNRYWFMVHSHTIYTKNMASNCQRKGDQQCEKWTPKLRSCRDTVCSTWRSEMGPRIKVLCAYLYFYCTEHTRLNPVAVELEPPFCIILNLFTAKLREYSQKLMSKTPKRDIDRPSLQGQLPADHCWRFQRDRKGGQGECQ
jgi:hypothetical protein